MPSAILSERDTAVPNRVFFSSNHPFCFLLLCFSMPHSVAYCVSIHASSWYFRHRKMMARSTVWLLRIHMMREGMARLRQHISIPGRTCRAAFLLVPVRVAIGNGSSIEWNQILNGWRKVCSRTSVPSPSCRSCLLWIRSSFVVVCPPTAWPVSNPRGERCTGATSFRCPSDQTYSGDYLESC